MSKRVIRLTVLSAVAASIPASVPAVAQTASQITPRTFAPNLQSGGGLVIPGGGGVNAPAGAEKLFVRLAGVSVKGGLPELAGATAALQTKLVGRKVSGAELFAAARELEAAYAAAGYVLVRVVLPPQTVKDGTRLALVVVDGFIERIETKDVPERVRDRIASLVGPLTGRRGVMLREIERRVLLAGDTPGVILRSTLTPGKAEGATILVIDAKHQAVSETLTFDNTLSAALGRTTLGAGLDFNSVAGFGELIYLRAAGHPDGGDNGFFDLYPRNRTLAGGALVPLWVEGLTFNGEYTDARTTPKPINGFRSTSQFQRLSLKLRYAWLRGRSANFNSELAFDAQDEALNVFVANVPGPVSLDRLRILRFANDGDVLTSWGAVISGRVTTSFGLNGLGARTAADATALLPLSRQGADASFQKLDVALGYNQTLVEHLAVSFSARAQYSFNAPLVRSEQIGIANTTGLSAFDVGSLVGDQGYVVRGELQSPWTVPLQNASVFGNPLGVIAAPYVFAAYGDVSLRNPTAVEAARIQASSYGGGIRLGGAAAGTLSTGTLSLEVSRAERSDGAASNRVTVVSAFRF